MGVFKRTHGSHSEYYYVTADGSRERFGLIKRTYHQDRFEELYGYIYGEEHLDSKTVARFLDNEVLQGVLANSDKDASQVFRGFFEYKGVLNDLVGFVVEVSTRTKDNPDKVVFEDITITAEDITSVDTTDTRSCTIDGIQITYLSSYDGFPIKNHAPEELKERLKTKLQWLELGFSPKENAEPYEMHPQAGARKTCMYYLDNDVEPINSETAPRSCYTCAFRQKYFCEIRGDYISGDHYCSEWIPLCVPDERKKVQTIADALGFSDDVIVEIYEKSKFRKKTMLEYIRDSIWATITLDSAVEAAIAVEEKTNVKLKDEAETEAEDEAEREEEIEDEEYEEDEEDEEDEEEDWVDRLLRGDSK